MDAMNDTILGRRMPRLVLASGNPGKLREFTSLLAPCGVRLVGHRELGIEDAEEPHPTFIENALAKARHVSRLSGLPALADDSGICVDALNGLPGVHSARYAPDAGGSSQDDANNARLIRELSGLTHRLARYVCVLVLLRRWDDPIPLVVEADWTGRVVDQALGQGGFGYDPHFWLPEQGCTAAQLSSELKNRLSHRGRAVRALMERLPGWLGEVASE